jgi:hypothetical protein
MRLELAFPPSWPRTDVADLSVIVAPDAAGAPELRFEISAFLPRYVVDGAELVGRVPAGYVVRRAEVVAMATVDGWPIALHPALVFDAGGVACELRVVARYEFLVYAAAVMLRAKSEGSYRARETEIRELFASARPSFAGDAPAAISELWDVT